MSTVHVVIARVPPAGVGAFRGYEDAVLGLLAEHGGRLERRLRAPGGTTEIHVVSFEMPDGLDAYRADPRRAAHAELLERSGAQVEPLELDDVETAIGQPAVLEGEHVVLRPIEPGDVAELRRIHLTAEVTEWWGELDDDFPADDPTATRFTVFHDGSVVGLVQYGEEHEPDYRRAWIDIYLDPAVHGRGLGSDAVATVLGHLIEDRDHHLVTVDPAAENLAAIACYERAGFVRVGVVHSAWRDGAGNWRDELLLEYVRT